LLREFHSFSREQCAKLREEGYSSLSDLVNWKFKDIHSLLENLSNRPSSRGGKQFGDRKIKVNGKSIFIDYATFNDFNREEWLDFYHDAREEFPIRMPEPLGNPVHVLAYVDANHAENMKTRRSHSGILMYMNQAPIIWYSKRQNTMEASSFGSEYIALRICTEMIEALAYKLRCFGVPVQGSSDILCDNQSVVTNSSVPTSVLNKRHNAICYHRIREAQAAGMIRVGWIEGEKNVADLFTKTTLSNESRSKFVQFIIDDIATPLPRT